MNQLKNKLSPEFLQAIQEDLVARKSKIEKELLSFAERDPHQQNNFNSDFPKFGDKEDENAAEVAAFESNLSLEETLEQSLEMTIRALKKLELGTYGNCEKCGQLIDEARLKIMPTATKCAPGRGCAPSHEE